jgi:hypothetical protein
MWRKWSWMFAPLLIATGPAMGAQQDPAISAEDCKPAELKLSFGFDSDSLDDMSRRTLDSAAAWVQESPTRRLKLQGFTDPSGNAAYNDDLSYRRAEAAKRHLVAQGIDPAKVSAVGEGEMSNIEPLGGAQQRAVMVLYCESPEAAATGAGVTPEPPAEPPTEAQAAPPPETGALAQAEALEEAIEDPAAAPLPPPPPMSEPITETVVAEEPPSGLEAIGLGVSLGGGVAGFTDDEARDLADVGGAWDVRVAVGTMLPVAFEGAYVGSAQNIDVFGLDTDTFLVGNGLEGNLRFQLPTKYVTPYVMVGLGWTHYSLTNTDTNNSLLEDNDDVITMPLGIGLTAFSVFGGTFDLRGVIKPTWQDTMFDGVYLGTGSAVDMHTWNVTGNLGWNF